MKFITFFMALVSIATAHNLFDEETLMKKHFEAKIYGCTHGFRFLALQKGRCNKATDFCVKFNEHRATIG